MAHTNTTYSNVFARALAFLVAAVLAVGVGQLAFAAESNTPDIRNNWSGTPITVKLDSPLPDETVSLEFYDMDYVNESTGYGWAMNYYGNTDKSATNGRYAGVEQLSDGTERPLVGNVSAGKFVIDGVHSDSTVTINAYDPAASGEETPSGMPRVSLKVKETTPASLPHVSVEPTNAIDVDNPVVTFTNAPNQIYAKKTINGGKPAAGQFTFNLYNSNADGEKGALVQGDVANNRSGYVVFDALEYEEAGTYYYLIEEVNDNQPGVTYDSEAKLVTVTVTKGETGIDDMTGEQYTGYTPTQHPGNAEKVVYDKGADYAGSGGNGFTTKTVTDLSAQEGGDNHIDVVDNVFCMVRHKSESNSALNNESVRREGLKRYNGELSLYVDGNPRWYGLSGSYFDGSAFGWTMADVATYLYSKEYNLRDKEYSGGPFVNSNSQVSVLHGQRLYTALKRLLYNGYPYNAAHLGKERGATAIEVAGITQQALYYVDTYGSVYLDQEGSWYDGSRREWINAKPGEDDSGYGAAAPNLDDYKALVEFALTGEGTPGYDFKEPPADTEIYVYMNTEITQSNGQNVFARPDSQPLLGIWAPTDDSDNLSFTVPTFANFSKEVNTTSVTVRKAWDANVDEADKVDVTVQLLKDNVPFGDAVTFGASQNWTYTWNNLEVGPEYSVEETRLAGFEAPSVEGNASQGFTIRNKKQTGVDVDIDDDEFTNLKPTLGTSAKDNEDQDSAVKADTAVEIKDTVEYTNLVPGKTYTVDATLHVKAVAEEGVEASEDTAATAALSYSVKSINGVAGATTFTAPEAEGDEVAVSGSFDVVFEVNTASLEGRDIVVFERLLDNSREVVAHAEIGDGGQTVSVEVPGTTDVSVTKVWDDADRAEAGVERPDVDALKDALSLKVKAADGTLSDVPAADIPAGQPTVTGTDGDSWAVKWAGLPELDEGEYVVVESQFEGYEAPAYDGEDSFAKSGETIKNALVVEETPSIGTTATDNEDGDKFVAAEPQARVKDVVTYSNLVPGKRYTLEGTLVKKDVSNPEHPVAGAVLDTRTVTFTADESGSGEVELVFLFDASELEAGEQAVAFETVKDGNVEVASHAVIGDEGQTVEFVKPEIGTTATDNADGDKYLDSAGVAVVQDEVRYSNLTPGKTYTISGKLVKKSDGSDVPGAVASKTFEASASGSGTEVLTFTVNARDLRGEALVAFEEVKYRGDTVATHAVISDENQTVYVPSIGTTASDAADNDTTLAIASEVTIKDVVAYSGLKPGTEYTINGSLHKKGADGSDAGTVAFTRAVVEGTDGLTFTPETADGEVTVLFTLDTSDLAGEKIVVFESVSEDGREIAAHANIADTNQTVEVENPETVNVSVEKKWAVASESTPVTVTLSANNADALEGVTTQVTLNAANSWKHTWANLPKEIGGTAVVYNVGETVPAGYEQTGANITRDNGDASFVFTNKKTPPAPSVTPSEEPSTPTPTEEPSEEPVTPEIGTTASDATDGDEHVVAEPQARVADTVSYSGLTPGKTYRLEGKLVKKSDGTDIPGATAETEFTPEAADGTVELVFTFDASALKVERAVAFEYVYDGAELVASHANINDRNQTVDFLTPEIGTVATEAETGAKVVKPESGRVIVDTVAYRNLTPGKQYTVSGKLIKKSDESVLVSAEDVFTASDLGSGNATLTFPAVDASALAGDVLVAYEYVFVGDVRGAGATEESSSFVAKHEDLEDEGQSVGVDNPTVKISKVSITDASSELPGATLQIRQGDTLIEEWVSTDTVHEVKLAPGEYTLTEVRAPAGYKVAETISFTVGPNGLGEGGQVQMVDEETPTVDVEFSKTWLNADNWEAAAPAQWPAGATVSVELLQDGNVLETVTLTAENTTRLASGAFTYSFTGLEDGHEYVAREVNVDGAFALLESQGENSAVNRLVPVKSERFVDFLKLNEKGEALEGAKLRLTGKAEDGTEVNLEWTSGASPWRVDTLKAGEYTLTELEAPAGYEIADPIEFTIDLSGTVLVGGQPVASGVVTMIDALTPATPPGGGDEAPGNGPDETNPASQVSTTPGTAPGTVTTKPLSKTGVPLGIAFLAASSLIGGGVGALAARRREN